MKQNLSLTQRLMADTPDFFKKVDFFGLTIVGLSVSLSGIVPAHYLIIAGSIGGTLTVISKFAVKDIAAIPSLTQTEDPAKTVAAVTDLANQATELKNDVENIIQAKPIAQKAGSDAPVLVPPVKIS